MRIAALSDIHGNLAALEAVWANLEMRKLLAPSQPVLNAGDTVAYGSETMACLEFVRDPARQIVSVGGNYDINVSRYPEKQDSYRKKWGKLRPDKFEAIEQASEQLTGDAREWLADLYTLVELELAGRRVSVSHYAPGSDKEGLMRSTPQSRLEQIADEVADRYDVVVTGHTHSPFVRQAGSVLFVNPGSVGRAWGDPTYAEITLFPDQTPSARIIRCPVTQQ